MKRALLIALLLFAATTALSALSFHVYHRDFFHLRRIYKNPPPSERQWLLQMARKVNRHDPRNTAVSMMLGEALIKVGEGKLGIQFIAAQARLHPRDPGILRAYADNLARMGMRTEADLRYRMLLEMLSAEEPLTE